MQEWQNWRCTLRFCQLKKAKPFPSKDQGHHGHFWTDKAKALGALPAIAALIIIMCKIFRPSAAPEM